MLKVAVIALKGGSGKTTLTKSLGVAAEVDGKKTLIVDMDPQGSALIWADRRGDTIPPEVISCPAPMLEKTLSRAEANDFDIVIFDTPPKLADTSAAAAKLADVVLVPCRPTQDDIDTLPMTKDLLAASTKAASFVVLNGCLPSKARIAESTETIETDHPELHVSPRTFGQRAAFADASIMGQTAQEYEPSGAAAKEITALYNWIIETVGKGK